MRKMLLIILLATAWQNVSLASFFESTNCRAALALIEKHKDLVLHADEREFNIFQEDRDIFSWDDLDDAPPKAKFMSKLSDEGELTFEVITRHVDLPAGASDSYLHSGMKAKDLFSMAMDHFGENVKTIKADWQFTKGGEEAGPNRESNEAVGDNLYMFEAALEKGLTPEEALFETWTGKQAQLHGFTKAKIDESESLKSNGRYFSLSVEFSK